MSAAQHHHLHSSSIASRHHATNGRPPRPPAPRSDGVSAEQAERLGLTRLFARLRCSSTGLTSAEAAERLREHGENILDERQRSVVLVFLGYFWGPIPWMIEVAAALSLAIGHWTDFVIILVMLLVNALVAFWQEHQAANALDALKQQMAPFAVVRRDDRWTRLVARELVPGDVIRLRLGDVVPADAVLSGEDPLSLDESALTGESLPVDKTTGKMAYSGTIVKRGVTEALVVNTGAASYFAKTANLAASARAPSHFQAAVLGIGRYLVYVGLGLAAVLVLDQLAHGEDVLTLLQFVLILVVASIPVAMPAVLSITMALGALRLSREKAIVSRLQSVEELAGVDVLCSDKTGTLTRNELTLGDPVVFSADTPEEVVLAAALASASEGRDAIDEAVVRGLEHEEILQSYAQERFVPFDPTRKRSDATVRHGDEAPFVVTKGAPHVIVDLCALDASTRQRATEVVDGLAASGFRTLGVARAADADGDWELLGFLPLQDPPRADSAETIRRAREHGIDVKMVTGDHIAIARQISQSLGLRSDIRSAEEIFAHPLDPELERQIETADGFAQVLPEHKYQIVKALQHRGHLVAMTGDGVNDTPALKQAEVGIAVSGATSAAQSAASLVLTAPGLGVIVNAVEEARRIFERMNSYAVYRITETIRIMLFVVLTMIAFDFYPITTVMIILLALLNDLPIMAIAYDHTRVDRQPVRWALREVLGEATVLGMIGVVETFGLLLIGKFWLDLSEGALQSLVYLKLAVAGHLTLLVVRTRGPFWKSPHPAKVLLGAVLGTQAVAVLIVGLGILVAPLPWADIALVWGYCIAWMFIEDGAKRVLHAHWQNTKAGEPPVLAPVMRTA